MRKYRLTFKKKLEDDQTDKGHLSTFLDKCFKMHWLLVFEANLKCISEVLMLPFVAPTSRNK
jgi:hypothetical protein